MILSVQVRFIVYISTLLICVVGFDESSTEICKVCDCRPNGIYCDKQTLTQYVVVDSELDVIYIKYSNISATFLSKPHKIHLKKLHIMSCNVYDIDTHSLENMQDLEIVEFFDSRLDHLPPKIFLKNTKLQIVGLMNNRITDIPDELFSPLLELVQVDLLDNQLQRISTGTFVTNEKIESLNVSMNNISKIEPGAFKVRNVTDFSPDMEISLNISHNKLQQVVDHTFSGCTHVTLLDLSHNSIKVLQPRAFAGLDHLWELRLEGNDLQVLEATPFAPLCKMRILAVGAGASCAMDFLDLLRRRCVDLRADEGGGDCASYLGRCENVGETVAECAATTAAPKGEGVQESTDASDVHDVHDAHDAPNAPNDPNDLNDLNDPNDPNDDVSSSNNAGGVVEYSNALTWWVVGLIVIAVAVGTALIAVGGWRIYNRKRSGQRKTRVKT